MRSGIYITIDRGLVGIETKDLITECTVSEFQEWLKSKNYDAYVETVGFERPLQRADFRLGFLLGLTSKYKITIPKVISEFNYFLSSFH